jgi:hypothetical protein
MTKLKNVMTTDKSLLDTLEKRWLITLNENKLEGIDTKLLNLLHRFYTLPGKVIPVWSCQSHPERKDRRFYIVFATNAAGLVSLTKVHDVVVQVYQDLGKRWPNLSRSRLRSDIYGENYQGPWTGTVLDYTFNKKCHTEETVDFLINSLHVGIETAKKDLLGLEDSGSEIWAQAAAAVKTQQFVSINPETNKATEAKSHSAPGVVSC